MIHITADEESRELAALYALGALDAREARDFEAHLAEGCAECAAEVECLGVVVESLGYAAGPADPPEGTRARLLAGLDGGPEEGAKKEAAKKEGADGFFVVRAGEGRWLETEDPGVTYKLLFADRERGTVTTLVRMAPGSSIPRHRHLGVEQCLVLEGDLRSGPHAMGAGDFNCSLPGSVHDELVTDGGALLLLVSPAAYERLDHHA